jgi:hypothetical protein
VEKSQRRPTRQGGANPRRLNDKTGAQGKKREEKRRNDNGEGVRDGRTRQRGGRREQNLSPFPRTEPHRGSGKTSLKEVEIKPNEKNSSLKRGKRAFRGG